MIGAYNLTGKELTVRLTSANAKEYKDLTTRNATFDGKKIALLNAIARARLQTLRLWGPCLAEQDWGFHQ